MTRRAIVFKARVEAFCAKLNAGLAAVAFVLAVVVSMVGSYRTIELMEINAQNQLAAGDQVDLLPQRAAY
jgi:hypothetical protein